MPKMVIFSIENRNKKLGHTLIMFNSLFNSSQFVSRECTSLVLTFSSKTATEYVPEILQIRLEENIVSSKGAQEFRKTKGIHGVLPSHAALFWYNVKK